MGDDVAERNVQKLRDHRHSILWLYRGLIGLRASERALTGGRYVPKRSINDVLYFERAVGGEAVMVALNLSEEPRKLVAGDGTLLISTRLDCNGASVSAGDILRGHEGIVVKLADTK
jgi:glycosidase